MKRGMAYLVGTGPGDPGLVTLRARQLIEQAEVLIYDYLCNPEILGWANASAEIIYAGKQAGQHTLTQEQINARLVEHVQAGKMVVRLKGGDPFVFGRGGEEAQEIIRAGLPVEIVPGVTSAVAAPAYAGIPVTHRDYTSSVTFLTGHEDPTKPTSSLDWQRLAQDPGTRVILMGVERLRQITGELINHQADPATPCALVRWGTYPRQETLEGTLATIVDLAEQRQFKPPAILIVGGVVKLRRELNWFENRPLFGRRIVVTRTRSQASALSEKLRLLGADVLEIPTIRIQPRAWTATYETNDFHRRFDWIVFTSPNAVDIFFDGYCSVQGDLRKLGEVKIAAVGPATAAKVKQLRLPIAKQPARFTVADLAHSFLSEEIAGQRFCLARGNLAEPSLAQYLQGLGGSTAEWTVYDTIPETADRTGARNRFINEGADWVTFTSASTVKNWHDLHLKPAPEAASPRYASIGPVTSEAMQKLGYSVACEATESTINGLVETLLKQL